jgi:hypothetical protein
MNEFELIDRLKPLLPRNVSVVVGAGDDCARLLVRQLVRASKGHGLNEVANVLISNRTGLGHAARPKAQGARRPAVLVLGVRELAAQTAHPRALRFGRFESVLFAESYPGRLTRDESCHAVTVVQHGDLGTIRVHHDHGERGACRRGHLIRVQHLVRLEECLPPSCADVLPIRERPPVGSCCPALDSLPLAERLEEIIDHSFRAVLRSGLTAVPVGN